MAISAVGGGNSEKGRVKRGGKGWDRWDGEDGWGGRGEGPRIVTGVVRSAFLFCSLQIPVASRPARRSGPTGWRFCGGLFANWVWNGQGGGKGVKKLFINPVPRFRFGENEITKAAADFENDGCFSNMNNVVYICSIQGDFRVNETKNKKLVHLCHGDYNAEYNISAGDPNIYDGMEIDINKTTITKPTTTYTVKGKTEVETGGDVPYGFSAEYRQTADNAGGTARYWRFK